MSDKWDELRAEIAAKRYPNALRATQWAVDLLAERDALAKQVAELQRQHTERSTVELHAMQLTADKFDKLWSLIKRAKPLACHHEDCRLRYPNGSSCDCDLAAWLRDMEEAKGK